LDLDSNNLFGKGIHANFFDYFEGFLEVFERVVGFERHVLVVECFPKFFGNWFGEVMEGADNVGIVEIINISYQTHACENTTRILVSITVNCGRNCAHAENARVVANG